MCVVLSCLLVGLNLSSFATHTPVPNNLCYLGSVVILGFGTYQLQTPPPVKAGTTVQLRLFFRDATIYAIGA